MRACHLLSVPPTCAIHPPTLPKSRVHHRTASLTTGSRFDDKYYARFYGDEQTRVTDEKATTKVATFVGAYLDYLDVPVTSVLDLGCGLGFWKDASQNVWKGSEYHGVEISDYLVRTHGWEHGSVVDYDTTQQYDLVVCCGVLQYLSDKDDSKAIPNPNINLTAR